MANRTRFASCLVMSIKTMTFMTTKPRQGVAAMLCEQSLRQLILFTPEMALLWL